MVTTIIVRGNVEASFSADVLSYKLTIDAKPTGVASITVTRTSSPLKGAATGTLSSGATIYYGDKLTATATASANYGSPTLSWTSTEVKGNVTISATAGTYSPPSQTECLCGETGYHWCPCAGEYGYPDDFDFN
jgi:hypothetical protein